MEQDEEERLGNRPTSAYEGRTQPAADKLPTSGGSTTGSEQSGADASPTRSESDATREERRREGGGAPGQRD
jgi:hypothetical protein